MFKLRSVAFYAGQISCLAQAVWALTIPSDSGQVTFATAKEHIVPTPLVIWHGLGDTAMSPGIVEFIKEIEKTYPGIYVYSIQIPEGGNHDSEVRAGFWGKAEEQAQSGCEQIARNPALARGFDGMGFSQGGLFLRYYAQYCDGPPMRNLITFGTPHLGIATLIPCPTPPTVTCLLAGQAARKGIYTSWAQDHLIQAQYFRDPARLDEFLEENTFLRDLNGEIQGEGYRSIARSKDNGSGEGLGGLWNIIAVKFDADHTVSPAQSAHWESYAADDKTVIIPLEETPLFTEDRIGLKALYSRGKLWREHCPGEHMDLNTGDCARNMVDRWVGWALDVKGQ